MRDFDREERTATTVRHSMTMPVNWMDMQRLIRVSVEDMGRERLPADDELWIEATDEEIAVVYTRPEADA